MSEWCPAVPRVPQLAPRSWDLSSFQGGPPGEGPAFSPWWGAHWWLGCRLSAEARGGAEVGPGVRFLGAF